MSSFAIFLIVLHVSMSRCSGLPTGIYGSTGGNRILNEAVVCTYMYTSITRSYFDLPVHFLINYLIVIDLIIFIFSFFSSSPEAHLSWLVSFSIFIWQVTTRSIRHLISIFCCGLVLFLKFTQSWEQ